MKIVNKSIKGVLSDIDGVITLDDKLLPNVKETIDNLNKLSIPIRFLTNTTSKTAEQIYEILASLNLDIKEDQIFTPVDAVLKYIRKNNLKNPYLFVNENMKKMFSSKDKQEYDSIIFGDPGTDFPVSKLEPLFRMMIDDKPLLALQMNRNYKKNGQLVLDIGAYIKALEFASNKKALNMGKPSHIFFDLALESMNLKRDDVLMIGDDIEFDVLGAKKLGIFSILVKTGKYRNGMENSFDDKPNLILNCFSELNQFLN